MEEDKSPDNHWTNVNAPVSATIFEVDDDSDTEPHITNAPEKAASVASVVENKAVTADVMTAFEVAELCEIIIDETIAAAVILCQMADKKKVDDRKNVIAAAAVKPSASSVADTMAADTTPQLPEVHTVIQICLALLMGLYLVGLYTHDGILVCNMSVYYTPRV